MTCIVGKVGKDGTITIGADSIGIAGYTAVVRKDPKVFVKGPFVYGFTGSFRMGQLIQYSFREPDHDPRQGVDQYMHNNWLDCLRACLEKGGYMRKINGEEKGGTFLVGYAGRLFCIESDFQIGEAMVDYYACGCGEEFAKGAMHAVTGIDTLTDEQKVLLALEAAETHSAGVRRPFLIRTIHPHPDAPQPEASPSDAKPPEAPKQDD